MRAYAGKAEEYVDAANIAKDLRRLLPLKTKTEYEPDNIAAEVAKKAVERAQRCVATARAVTAGLK